ncbi:MAG: MauE/DoxX family redox-associated membrane protein, partial [Saprospiraceae bacterium]
MTLLKLLFYIAIAAVVLTVVIGIVKKGHKTWVMTALQNFTGILFIISGFVKAVDPVGTAFKMEHYFTEFEYTLQHTWFAFMAPLFPFLSTISLFFSVTMIVLEIVLGLALLLGHRAKLTSWALLLLVGFFTVLTGFTFLTGYVPSEATFFQFSHWGPYAASN